MLIGWAQTFCPSFKSGMSALKDEELFRAILKSIGKRTAVVETGTHQGLSALLLSEFAERVYTFDVVDYVEKYVIWRKAGVQDRITFYKIGSDFEKGTILESLKFDLAFIDGDHYAGIDVDFWNVAHCGKVLFHDYRPDSKEKTFQQCTKFVDNLGTDVMYKQPPFALWQSTKYGSLNATSNDLSKEQIDYFLEHIDLPDDFRTIILGAYRCGYRTMDALTRFIDAMLEDKVHSRVEGMLQKKKREFRYLLEEIEGGQAKAM